MESAGFAPKQRGDQPVGVDQAFENIAERTACMSPILKIVIATVLLGVFGFVVDSMTDGGHWIIWALAGAVYGVVCYPWFTAIKQQR